MFGSGTYSIGTVKEVKVTDEFVSLETIQKQCQSEQSFEQCTNNQLLAMIKENCKCIPYELVNFTNSDKVRSIFIIKIK